MILLGTNVLVRMTRRTDPQAAVTRSAIQTLLARGERLVIFRGLPVTVVDPATV